MTSLRQVKVSELIRQIAGDFIEIETNRTSLITITRVNVAPNLKNSTIFVTILPEKAEKDALDFLKRQRSNFRQYIKKRRVNLRVIPFFDFEIDYGEKNRQNITDILVRGKSNKNTEEENEYDLD
jgi:ribosome-binding factor A